jgi:hypothetical protein
MATAKEELLRFAESASEEDALTALAILEDRAPDELREVLSRTGPPHPDSLAIDADIAAGRTDVFESDEAFDAALADRQKPQ